MNLEEYLSLITSAHSGKSRFEATVSAGISQLASAQSVLNELIKEFDIDTAVGVQLDVLGIWIGQTRRINTPMTDVYFSWDAIDFNGWDSGVWKKDSDPDSGLVDLPDEDYRTLLKAKIAANRWDGSVPEAYKVWNAAFDGDTYIVIQDNQDMSVVFCVSGKSLSAVEKSLLVGGFFKLKPEGVRISYWLVSPHDGPLFAWDIEPNDAFSGWEEGNWAIKLEN